MKSLTAVELYSIYQAELQKIKSARVKTWWAIFFVGAMFASVISKSQTSYDARGAMTVFTLGIVIVIASFISTSRYNLRKSELDARYKAHGGEIMSVV